MYGPYRDQECFWEKAHRGGILSILNLVLGGDLNLVFYSSEIWGKKASPDPLSSHFRSLFNSVGLVDIAPSVAGPTWRNGRSGNEGISKRLDRFLMSTSLIQSLGVHRVWTHVSDISDHHSICLE